MELLDPAAILDFIVAAFNTYWFAAVGAGILAVFAAYHFNSPDYVLSKQIETDQQGPISDPTQLALARTKLEAPPILTTRRERYRRSLITYVVVLEAVFIFYVLFPDLFSEIAKIAQVQIIVPDDELQRVIYGLFGLMGLYATFPGLNQWDKKIREKLHQAAIIPEDVKFTATQIFKAEYSPSDELKATARQGMNDTLMQINYEDAGDSLIQEWFRLSCAYTQLQELMQSEEFRSYQRFLSPESDDISREYASREQQILTLINKESETRSPPEEGDEEDEERARLNLLEAEFILEFRENLSLKISVLYYRVCLLLSMMFFATEKTANSIQKRFGRIGYDVKVPPIPPIDWETIIKTLLTTGFVIFVPSLIYFFVKERYQISTPSGSGITVPESINQTLLWSVNILVLHMLCIFVAIMTKRMLAKRRARTAGGTERRRASPVVDNAIVFVLCYLTTYSIGIWLFYPDHGWRVLRIGIPWAVVPALTGCFVGFYIDRIMADKKILWWRKYLQGVLMGLFAAFASFLFTPQDPIIVDIPPVIWLYVSYISGMQFLVGLGIGWIFPSSYQKRIRPSEGSDDVSPPASAAPIPAAT